MEFDFEAWPRRGIYEFFSGLSQPFYSVTFTLDVTKLYACVKRRGLSFYYALTWLVTEAVNSVPRISWGPVYAGRWPHDPRHVGGGQPPAH